MNRNQACQPILLFRCAGIIYHFKINLKVPMGDFMEYLSDMEFMVTGGLPEKLPQVSTPDHY